MSSFNVIYILTAELANMTLFFLFGLESEENFGLFGFFKI